MSDFSDSNNDWEVKDIKIVLEGEENFVIDEIDIRTQKFEEDLQRKSGKDVSIRFLESGTIGIWSGYCRECDYEAPSSESFLDTTDEMAFHNDNSGHEVLVAGNVGDAEGDLMIEVIELLEEYGNADACKQCGMEESDDDNLIFGLCRNCHPGPNERRW